MNQDDEHTVLASSAPQGVPPSAPGLDGDNALPAGARLGDFEIVGILGIGGFGIVYRAHDHSLDRDVALKEYMPSSLASRVQSSVRVNAPQHAEMFQAGLRSFINEARMLAHFDHPALVKVYQFWEANGTAYMVMPCYHGKTLKQSLQDRAAPPGEAWLKKLLAQLLDALELIHAQHCYHRDIAPDNILMLDDTRPLLLDFGAARRAIEGMTQAFTVILKQGYAPIEQYADVPGMQQGAWTDLYALASVVHYAIDGRPPVPAVARIIADPYVPLAGRLAGSYSAGFLAAIDRALAVKAEQRPQSVAEMRTLLGLDDGGTTVALPPESPTDVPAPLGDAPVPPADVPAPPAASSAPLTAATDLPASSPAPLPPVAATHVRPRGPVYAGVAAAALAMAALGYFVLRGNAPAPPEPAATPSSGPAAPREAGRSAPVATTAPTPAVPAAPTVPPAAAEPGGVFEPVAALDAILAGASADRTVTVRVDKPRVRIGRDALEFSVRASHTGYVYLYMVGSDRNNFWLLFPNAIDRNNAIAAGETRELPGSARRSGRWRLEAGGPPGTDHLVVMVSDAPRRFDAAGLVPGEAFAEFPIARAAQLQRAHTGPAPLFAGQPDCPGTPCSPVYGAAAFAVEEIER